MPAIAVLVLRGSAAAVQRNGRSLHIRTEGGRERKKREEEEGERNRDREGKREGEERVH